MASLALVFDNIPNDSLVKNYSRMIGLGWLANTDITPCTYIYAVLNYMSNYCSKGETQIESYRHLARSFLPMVSDHQPMISFVSRLMNKLVSEQDWSAQEVCHLSLNIPSQSGTRVTVTVSKAAIEEAEQKKDWKNLFMWCGCHVYSRSYFCTCLNRYGARCLERSRGGGVLRQALVEYRYMSSTTLKRPFK